mmetsp:Transcript_27146/g.63396  ORF Transcript_27146/g.63396 Transcript_27146/m.63396 type:complete len:155 (-) Transcript_27146:303-767(-)
MQVESHRFNRRMVEASMVFDLILLVESLVLGNGCFALLRLRYTADSDSMSPWIVPFLRRSQGASGSDFSHGPYSPSSFRERDWSPTPSRLGRPTAEDTASVSAYSYDGGAAVAAAPSAQPSSCPSVGGAPVAKPAQNSKRRCSLPGLKNLASLV